MARTGVAAMAASVLGDPLASMDQAGGQGDPLASMDQASRFRRKHRPAIPELFPELYTDGEYSALAEFGSSQARMLPDYTTCIQETLSSPMRSYRDCVLEKAADRS